MNKTLPTLDDIVSQMRVIQPLEQAVAETKAESAVVDRELTRRQTALENSRNELGRMLKASGLLSVGDYRVVHRDEAIGSIRLEQLFGIHRLEG